MSDTKWTPGPWVAIVGKCGDHAGYVHSIKQSDRGGFPIVADIVERTRDGTHEANAHLIAAAPDLYEALADAVAYLHAHKHTFCAQALCDKVDAALAKAEGRS